MYKSNVYKRGEIYKTRSINKAAWEDTLSHPKPKATQKKSIYLLSSYSVISYTIVPKNMTMLKNKRITFSLIFVCLVMVSPMAKAQLGGLGGLLGGGGGGGGGLGGLLGGGGLGGLLGNGGLGGLLGGGGGGGVLGGILGLINIQGVLRCSANGNVSAPAFVNAGVQLQCGGQNNVVSTSTTNAAGLFSMLVNPIQLVLSTLLSDCQVAVTTPLSTCNAALPTGQLLSSSLALVGETVSGLLRVANLRPTGFTLA